MSWNPAIEPGGGATLSGPRYIWWNFVASSRTASKKRRPNGAPRTGARDVSISRSMTEMSTFPYQTDRC